MSSAFWEGFRSAFTLFPQHTPHKFEIRKRERLTLQQAMEKDAQALREDLRKAFGVVRCEADEQQGRV
jgi:hypothetical protein